jgi:LppX_LprAFG lipoprotein
MFRKLAPALLAPLLVAAACASEADDAAIEVRTGAAAAVALRAAPDAAAEAGTAAFEMVMDMTVGGESIEVLASGAYDARNERMSLQMDLGGMFDEMASMTGESVPAEFEEPLHMIADGSTVYLRSPIFSLIGGSDEWLSLTPDDLGLSAEQLGLGAGAYDPSTILESLRGVTGEPEVVGTEEVRGVPTTRYTATMDMAQALAELPDDQSDLVESQLEQLGDDAVPVDVWVDDEGLPRRVQIDMSSILAGESPGTSSVLMTMEFFAYGEPVDIQVPSPDEVTAFSDVLGGIGGIFEDVS